MKKVLTFLVSAMCALLMFTGCPNNAPEEEKVDDDSSALSLSQQYPPQTDGYPAVDEDIDGDGLTTTEERSYGTNPYVKDTDGDGWTDGEEAELYTKATNSFNPLVADMPKLKMEITSAPSITWIYTNSEDHSTSTSSAMETSTETSSTSSQCSSSGISSEFGWNASITAGYNAEDGFNGSVTAGVSGAYTSESSIQYTTEESKTMSTSVSNEKSIAESKGLELTGGKISVTVSLKNPSAIGYKVSDLSVSLFKNGTGNIYTPVANMISSVGTFSLKPDETKTNIIFTADGLSIDDIKKLTENTSAIVVKLVSMNFEMTYDGNTSDFTGESTAVAAKNAMLSIDFGPSYTQGASYEEYAVSTKQTVNKGVNNIDDLYSAITLRQFLTNAKLLKTEDSPVILTDNKISSVRKLSDETDNNASWYIYKTSKDSVTNTTLTKGWKASDTDASVDVITVSTGETIQLLYSVDADKDGVPLSVETIYGTDDKKEDTDDDKILDKLEIYGHVRSGENYNVTISPCTLTTPKSAIVYTNPAVADTDGDGLKDADDAKPNEKLLSSDATLSSIKIGDVELNSETADSWIKGNDGNYTVDFKNKKENSEEMEDYNIPGDQPTITLTSKNATIKYTQNTDTTETLLTSESLTPKSLNVGVNKFVFTVTSEDKKNTLKYTVNFNSVLSPVKIINNSDEKDKNVVGKSYQFNFEQITPDTRVKGIVFYCGDKTNLDNVATNLNDDITDRSVCSTEIATTTRYSVKMNNYSTKYTYYIFTSDGVNHSEVATQSVTSGRCSKGIFTLGLGYLHDKWDGNGGGCDYYVSITSRMPNAKSLFEKTYENNNGTSIRLNDDVYYYFTDEIANVYTGGKNGWNYKYFDGYTFNTDKDTSLTFDFWVKEEDGGSGCFVGKSTIVFNYSQVNNSWTPSIENITYNEDSDNNPKHTDSNYSKETLNLNETKEYTETYDTKNSGLGNVEIKYNATWEDVPDTTTTK